MPRIMIIRHGEKHSNGGRERGVNIEGEHTKHELTVRGWQRAGALVRYFAPVDGRPAGPAISAPRSIIASAATHDSPSLRAQHTVMPLAELLGIQIDARYPEGEEVAAAAAALAAEGPVLVSWHHSHIPLLVDAIAGVGAGRPADWPDDRFDVVWTLDQAEGGGPWTFAQTPQCLFAQDRPVAI